MELQIRTAVLDDLDMLAEIEKICFPEAEAADKDIIKRRIEVYGNHFLVLEKDHKIIGFINGMITDEETIRDEMFETASLHNEKGQWQSVFGLDVLPEYRRCGYGALLMEALIKSAKEQCRTGCILTCKKELIHYYEKFGYCNMGISASVHGGSLWYDMKLEFTRCKIESSPL